MRHCPHCHHPTIPWWHAHLGSVFSKPIICTNCHSTLVRVIGLSEVIAMAPLVVIMVVLYYEDYPSMQDGLLWLLMTCGFFIGMCLWSHTVRYKVKPNDTTVVGKEGDAIR
jgi:hypothetical protein